MQVNKVPPKEKPKTPRDVLREKNKGKTSLTRAELDEVLLQMARDLGYLGEE